MNPAYDADVVIAGAGPAGAAAACHLTRLGASVILLDRAAFPRDKVCGDFVGPSALIELELSRHLAIGWLRENQYRATRRTFYRRRSADRAAFPRHRGLAVLWPGDPTIYTRQFHSRCRAACRCQGHGIVFADGFCGQRRFCFRGSGERKRSLYVALPPAHWCRWRQFDGGAAPARIGAATARQVYCLARLFHQCRGTRRPARRLFRPQLLSGLLLAVSDRQWRGECRARHGARNLARPQPNSRGYAAPYDGRGCGACRAPAPCALARHHQGLAFDHLQSLGCRSCPGASC